MAKRERRTFSDEQKAQIMQEIQGDRKLIDVAAEHQIPPSQISQWKRKMGLGKSSGRKLKNSASTASQPKIMNTPQAAPFSRQRSSSKHGAGNGRSSNSTIDELERMIGQLSVENARLRRELEGR